MELKPFLNNLIILALLIFIFAVNQEVESSPERLPENGQRVKRQTEEPHDASGEAEGESGSGEPPAASGGGVSLGKILGIVFLACCIIYCIGISWKVYKVCKGTYVEEEPVFLKYK